MKLGAERKKVAILVGLLLVAAVVFWINSTDSPASQGVPAGPRNPSVPATGTVPSRESASRTSRAARSTSEFRPSLRPKRDEVRPDPMSIDPTLRLDVLAKLKTINVEGSRRSVFDFGAAPPPKPDPKTLAAAKPKVPSPIVPAESKPDEAAETDPAKPKAPPVPLKFYGYISPVNQPGKRAFFVEGEEIHVVTEGETVKKRYKIVRIGINSVVVEDTQFGSQQTLPLEEQPG